MRVTTSLICFGRLGDSFEISMTTFFRARKVSFKIAGMVGGSQLNAHLARRYLSFLLLLMRHPPSNC